ncbi:site-specific DNA-methyltransferase [Agrobacterium tumefaciens]|uniref:DNA methyltransferase n=1 Tax=Agrobacterium tumefaciens TaxID=358 RepID=UPI0015737BCC|nr:site-specific DNA-methyltransferase [Agrobacterium tumefaciens]
MTSISLHPGDNRASLRRLIADGVRVHSVVSDPPYGLVSIQKRFGKEGAAPARREKNDGSFARLSGGFMGRKWDGTGIERDPEFWKLIYDILLPGGYVFAFSGSRTGHWQACAMEIAGFIMHPMHGWCFGSGFPKAHAADKAIDKHLGVEGHINAAGNPVKRMIPGADQHRNGSWIKDNGREYQPGTYVPGSDEAALWEGWAYGTQAQKPALEPIYLAQKPFSEKNGPINLLKHGVGAVNIDGCRVNFTDAADEQESKEKNKHADFGSGAMNNQVYGKFSKDRENYDPTGRHPSNLILDGSPEVLSMFPGEGSSSSARFFHQFPLSDEDYESAMLAGLIGADCGDALIYHAKAGKSDRAHHLLPVDENGKPVGAHPTVKPIALMQNLIRHITPPGGIVLDPFAGSGTTAEAARREGFDCILMEAETEYVEFLERRFPEIEGHNQKMLLMDEQLAENSFLVCSHSETKGLNSYIADLIGETVDLSDLI